MDNWQSALRRQYLRRDPAANPIGVESSIPKQSRSTTVTSEVDDKSNGFGLTHVKPAEDSEDVKEEHQAETVASAEMHNGNMHGVEDIKGYAGKPPTMSEKEETRDSADVEDEAKDWIDLSMLDKLESIHTVAEWHFQNPSKLRQIMRSDDEDASWVRCSLGC